MMDRLRALAGQRSILLQLGAVILLCQLLAQIVAVAFVVWRFERPDILRLTSVQTVEAVTIYQLLAVAEPGEQEAIAALLARSGSTIALSSSRSLTRSQESIEPASHIVLQGLASVAPDIAQRAWRVASADPAAGERIAIDTPGGRSVVFDPKIDARMATLPRVIGSLQISIAIVSLGLLSLWAVRMLTAPVARLAASASRFAIDLDPTPLPERGPAELRALARAFNTMRERIRQLLESRSRMLAAVSHDLRTPLTRIRLRVEAQEEGEERDRSLRDIATMDRMISQALSYLRDQVSPAQRERVDLAALVETVCSDFADTGKDVTFGGQRNIVLECESDLICRAISNLIDNAVKFGGRADVEVAMRSASEAVVHVRDDGPGIADADKHLAFEPFSRGDASRGSPGADGFGLGLAIARQLVERHGGSITLHDREPSGLDAQVVLPIFTAAGAGARMDKKAAASAPVAPVTP
jgi:signal transduction histidine kinase